MYNDSLLRFDKVTFSINNKKINSDISFEVSKGDLLSIIGPNGSGKSTIVKLASGDIEPDFGSIKFKNFDIKNWTLEGLARNRSILSQANHLSFPFTAIDVLRMGRVPIDGYGSLINPVSNEIFDLLINIFELDALKNQSYMTLSGGERQRVQLARCFAQIWSDDDYSGKLLILDEPTSFLDIRHQIILFDLIKKLNGKGLAVIMVLHDLSQAIANSKSVLMLKSSRLEYFGEVGSTINKDSINKVFDVNYDSNAVNHMGMFSS